MKFYPTKSKQNRIISLSGFTLIEVMIAITIVAILTSIGIPNYIKYKEKARVQVAITDIRFIEKEIMNFAVEFGELPEELSDLGRDQVLDPWGRPYIYLRIQGSDPTDPKFKPRKDLSLHPINTDFDLCSMGRDGKSKAPLTAEISKDDVVRANNGGFVGLVSNY